MSVNAFTPALVTTSEVNRIQLKELVTKNQRKRMGIPSPRTNLGPDVRHLTDRCVYILKLQCHTRTMPFFFTENTQGLPKC